MTKQIPNYFKARIYDQVDEAIVNREPLSNRWYDIDIFDKDTKLFEGFYSGTKGAYSVQVEVWLEHYNSGYSLYVEMTNEDGEKFEIISDENF